MAFANNNGVRIHYQVEGVGPPLVILHGFTDSIVTWYEVGYVDALRGRRKLILIDARGHGESDKPHSTAAYSTEKRVADVVAVLDNLGIDRADIWGYSMGGRSCFAMARHAPDRVRSLIIGGAAGDSRSRIGNGFRRALKGGGAAAIPGTWGIPVPESIRARLLANDPVAIEASLVDGLGFADMLSSMTMPCLVYAGTADPIYPLVEETIAEMPNVTFFALPDVKHSEGLFQRDVVVPRVVAFLAKVDGSGA
jgi:pimeloyl-ACP methyl ester carboxylesterase